MFLGLPHKILYNFVLLLLFLMKYIVIINASQQQNYFCRDKFSLSGYSWKFRNLFNHKASNGCDL